jgi:hypothetical protein
MSAKYSCPAVRVGIAHGTVERPIQVNGSTKATGHSVTRRLRNPKKQGLKRLDVLLVPRQVHAEAIPGASMSVSKVTVHSTHKIARETHVIELVLLVECVDAVLPADQGSDDFAVLFQNTP